MRKRSPLKQLYPREYRIWSGIKSRVYDKNSKSYSAYGGSGIAVCDEWKNSFDNFIGDMGACPADHSIDRIDPNGDYTAENCRWADKYTQAINRRLGKNNTSGYRGVSWFKPRKKWTAKISVHKKYMCIGYYDTAIEAAMAYDKEAIKHFGQDAKPNLLRVAA